MFIFCTTCSENTIPAFLSVLDGGVDTVELDLLLSQDNAIVVHHNYRLNPMTSLYDDGSSILTDDMKLDYKPCGNHLGGEDVRLTLVNSLTLSELQSYDVGSLINNEKYPKSAVVKHSRIPTLIELFEAVSGYYKDHPEWGNMHHIRFNLEIKRESLKPGETSNLDFFIPEILRIVDKFGMQDNVKYSSFDMAVLRHLRGITKTAIIGMLYEPCIEDEPHIVPLSTNVVVTDTSPDYQPSERLRYMISLALDIGVDIISTNHKHLSTRDDISFLKFAQDGIKRFCVVCYTVNERADWGKCMDWGVDGIITDFPLELVDYLNAL